MTAYRTAIDHTVAVIERRARAYRNQVIVVALIGVVSVVWAATTRSAGPLAALLLVIPSVGGFFCVDARLLDRWRSTVTTRWAGRELDLSAFRSAVRACPGLPKDTTEAMLASLPSLGDLVAEQRVLAPTRRAIDAASAALHAIRAASLVTTTIASAIVVGTLVLGLWQAVWRPLLGLAGLGLVFVARVALRRRAVATRDAAVAACRDAPGFDLAEFERALAGLGDE